MHIQYSLAEIKHICGATRQEGGAHDIEIHGLQTLAEAGPGELSFLGNKKYKQQVKDSRASVLLLPMDYEGEPADGQIYLFVEDPSKALSLLCVDLEKLLFPKPEPFIHPSAIIHENAHIGENVYIGPNCVIEEDASIGSYTHLTANCYIGRHVHLAGHVHIMPNVTLYDHTHVGEYVTIHAGCVIGSEGFGFDSSTGKHISIPQVGKVSIESHVHMGAGVCIDRARFGITRIGEGTRIDNLVHVAHNVQVGKHCILVGQCGIAGSTVLEDYVVLGGQVGVTGHVRLGKGVQVTAQSGINNDVEAGLTMRGTPAINYMTATRYMALRKNLPDLFKRVAKIEELIEHLGESQNAS